MEKYYSHPIRNTLFLIWMRIRDIGSTIYAKLRIIFLVRIHKPRKRVSIILKLARKEFNIRYLENWTLCLEKAMNGNNKERYHFDQALKKLDNQKPQIEPFPEMNEMNDFLLSLYEEYRQWKATRGRR